MKLSKQTITKAFYFAGATNMLVLIFSKFFTNGIINKYDPSVMSNFGLVMIVVWGLAYIAAGKNFYQVKWLVAVFAIEKLIYGIIWIDWMIHNNVSTVYNEDALAGVFYSIYGISDWSFCVFFSIVFFLLHSSKGGFDTKT